MEAGLGEHTVCACTQGLAPWDPGSGWAALSEGCSAWGHGVFSAIIILGETYSSAGIQIGVMQLEFCCSTVAPALELSTAFPSLMLGVPSERCCGSQQWSGNPGAVRCLLVC